MDVDSYAKIIILPVQIPINDRVWDLWLIFLSMCVSMCTAENCVSLVWKALVCGWYLQELWTIQVLFSLVMELSELLTTIRVLLLQQTAITALKVGSSVSSAEGRRTCFHLCLFVCLPAFVYTSVSVSVSLFACKLTQKVIKGFW